MATGAIIVFGFTDMIHTILGGSIIDHVVFTNHDVTPAQLVASVWLVLGCVHWLAISMWLPKVLTVHAVDCDMFLTTPSSSVLHVDTVVFDRL